MQSAIDAEALARDLADSSLQSQLDELNVSVVDREYIAGDSIVIGDVVIHSTTAAGEVIKANAEAIATCESVAGVALAAASASESVMVRTFGIATVNQDAAFDLGKRVYVSAATAGNATKTAPTGAANVVYLLGGATDTDEVFVNSNLEYIVYSE